MGLEKTIRTFSSELHRLQDRLQELRLTVVEDRPARNDAVIVDNLEYAVEDLLGWVKESLHSVKRAEQAVDHPVDMDQARQALTSCQERIQRMEKVFSENLVSYERMKDLSTFGSERRGEWPSWVTSVKQGIEHCKHPLDNARMRMAECWQEIAERVGMTSISVRTTNIGQKITAAAAPVAGDDEWVKQGIT
jgi:response regulator RpfG family c-di-GMP phosphodiesterase